jgi:hypothetical protein
MILQTVNGRIDVTALSLLLNISEDAVIARATKIGAVDIYTVSQIDQMIDDVCSEKD